MWRRIHGKHIEVSSVTLEEVTCAPEIAQAIRARLVGVEEAARRKAALEAELRKKDKERHLAEQQAAIDKVQAETESETRLTRAKAEAESIHVLAKAHAEERRAESTTITPPVVQMKAYEALGKLGGEGTHIMLGDWSKLPSWLFPQMAGLHLGAGNTVPTSR